VLTVLSKALQRHPPRQFQRLPSKTHALKSRGCINAILMIKPKIVAIETAKATVLALRHFSSLFSIALHLLTNDAVGSEADIAVVEMPKVGFSKNVLNDWGRMYIRCSVASSFLCGPPSLERGCGGLWWNQQIPPLAF
jgi:hypothetical protein